MKLHVDLETLQLIEGPGFRNPVTSLRFKRGDAAQIDVTFLVGGFEATAIGNPEDLEIEFGIKPWNRYDSGYLVHETAWTMPSIDTPSIYRCSPSFNTEELNAALGVGTGTELPEVRLMGEITWREGAGEPTSTRTFLVVVENDVNRGTEGTPQGMPDPEEWLAARQGALTRGGAEWPPINGVAATATLTVNVTTFSGQTVKIGSETYYINPETLPATEYDVQEPFPIVTTTTYAENIAAVINLRSTLVNAMVAGNVITLIAKDTGAAGSAIVVEGTATTGETPKITGTQMIGGASGVEADYIGQLCRVGEAGGIYLWYRWDGEKWHEDEALTREGIVATLGYTPVDPQNVKITASKSVANQAARLGLSLEYAKGYAVVDADTGKTWMLTEGGTPSNAAHWLQLGDRDISWADVSKSGALPSDIGAVASSTTGIAGATTITNIVRITQAAYNALGAPDANITYIIIP